MKTFLMLSTVAVLGSAGFAAAQTESTTGTGTDAAESGLATENAFSLPQAQDNDGVIELGTVTVDASCGTEGTTCTIAVYDVTDEAMANNLAEDNVVTGGANTDVKVTLRTLPTSDVFAVLLINGTEAARAEIDFNQAGSGDSGDSGESGSDNGGSGGGDGNDGNNTSSGG